MVTLQIWCLSDCIFNVTPCVNVSISYNMSWLWQMVIVLNRIYTRIGPEVVLHPTVFGHFTDLSVFSSLWALCTVFMVEFELIILLLNNSIRYTVLVELMSEPYPDWYHNVIVSKLLCIRALGVDNYAWNKASGRTETIITVNSKTSTKADFLKLLLCHPWRIYVSWLRRIHDNFWLFSKSSFTVPLLVETVVLVQLVA